MRSKLAWCFAAPIVGAALLELTVAALDLAPPRVAPLRVWNEERDEELHDGASHFRFHPRWLWEPRPGALVHDEKINDDGYRGPRLERGRSPRLRIAVLGESATFGMGMAERDTWPRKLETLLRARGQDVELMNFGVTAFTVVQGRELYVGRVRAYEPDVVLACFGGVNETQQAPGGMTDARKIEVLSGFAYRARVFFERFGSVRWLASLGERAPTVVAAPAAADSVRVPLDEYRSTIARLGDDVARDGAALVIVLQSFSADGLARRPAIHAYRAALKELARERELPLADLTLVLDATGVASADDAVEAAPATVSPYFDAWHPNEHGHALIAETVADLLASSRVLEVARRQ